MRKLSKSIKCMVSLATLLIALAFSSAAVGQTDDYNPYGGATLLGFEEYAGGGATLLGFEEYAGGGATLQGFYNGDAPLGGGLLVLALSGVCYAGAKRKKGERLKGERLKVKRLKSSN